ncbi:MAG: hypothetical protein ACI8XB_001288 [Patiriisocius sp.]
MRVLQFFIVVILTSFLGFTLDLNAQENTWELKPTFKTDSLEEYFISPVYTFQLEYDIDFSGFSAYESLAAETGVYQYRAFVNGEWSDWTSYRSKFKNVRLDRRSFEADPVFGQFEKIQFSSLIENAEPTFRLFFAFRRELELSPARASNGIDCDCELPAYCSRECWCPSGSCDPLQEPLQIEPTHVIVHHSAGFNESENFASVVAYYFDLHVNTNGWDDIGYNWLVDANGIIYEGRGSEAQGAHFSCMNEATTGICMIGDFSTLSPSEAAMEALQSLISWEACDKTINPIASELHAGSEIILPNVCGHRDGNVSSQSCSATVCPGDVLYDMIDVMRTEIAENECLDLQTEMVEIEGNIFDISPNPFFNYITITTDDTWAKNNYHFKVYDLKGSLVTEQKENGLFENSTMLDLSSLTSGVYFLEITTDKYTMNHRIVRK